MRPVTVRRVAARPDWPVLAGRSAYCARRLIHRVEDAPYLVLHEIAEAFAAARAGTDGRDDPSGGRHADVGRNQQLLERFNRLDIDLPCATRPGVSTLHDLVETTNDLLLGATQTLAQAVKKCHIPPGPLPLPRLGALRPQHQVVQGGSCVLSSGQELGHLGGDR